MNLFKWGHFEHDIIIWTIRWYCKYGISYRDLEEMMSKRGIEVNSEICPYTAKALVVILEGVPWIEQAG